MYALRAAPSVCALGDSAELASAARALGLPHAPGYPLLTVLGRLATELPGDPDGLLNLTSAGFHAAAVMLVFALVFTTTGRLSAALVGALSLALSRSFLLGSLYYEAFPLADLFAAAALYVAARVERVTRHGGSTGTHRALCVLAALLGLAGAHHQMAILLVPAVLVLAGRPLAGALIGRSGWQVALSGVAPFVLSLALVWWLGSRGAAYERLEISSWSAFWAQITRAEYGGLLSSSTKPHAWMPGARLTAFGWLLLTSVRAPALVLAAWGALRGSPSTRRPRVALALTFFLAGPLFFLLNRTELAREENLAWMERFATLAHVPLAGLVGFGFHSLLELARTRVPQAPQALLGVGLGLVTVLPALSASHDYDLSNHDAADALISDVLAHTESDAVLLVYGDASSTLLVHACLIEGRCEDREVHAPIGADRPGSSWHRVKRRGAGSSARSGGRGSAWLEVLTQSVGKRPTYVSPALLVAYPEIARRYRVVPGVHLLRVLPPDAPPLPALLATSERTRSHCSGCISLARPEARPSMLEEHRRGYFIGLDNLVRSLTALAPTSPERAPLTALRTSLQRTPVRQALPPSAATPE